MSGEILHTIFHKFRDFEFWLLVTWESIMSGMRAFPADVLDIPQIQSIYEYYVLNSTATFEEIPPSIDDMAVRFQTITAKGGVWLVAKEPGEGIIYGYAYYGPYRERSGYRYTVENSIYVRNDFRGRGVGKVLLEKLIELATDANMRSIIAVVGGGEAENPASISLHARFGFEVAGTLRSCGIKFDRWVDTTIMQKHLRES